MSNEKLIKGEDFYIENGFYVFTEKYLKDRGYCCGSGCRHCPYSEEKIVDSTSSHKICPTKI